MSWSRGILQPQTFCLLRQPPLLWVGYGRHCDFCDSESTTENNSPVRDAWFAWHDAGRNERCHTKTRSSFARKLRPDKFHRIFRESGIEPVAESMAGGTRVQTHLWPGQWRSADNEPGKWYCPGRQNLPRSQRWWSVCGFKAGERSNSAAFEIELVLFWAFRVVLRGICHREMPSR